MASGYIGPQINSKIIRLSGRNRVSKLVKGILKNNCKKERKESKA